MPPRHKLIVMGDAYVGKTTLLERLSRGVFVNSMESTVATAFTVLRYDNMSIDIWDTAGQERYRSFVPMFARGAHIALICFCGFDADTVSMWIRESRSAQPDVRIILVHTKSDVADRASVAAATEYASLEDIPMRVTSSYTGQGIECLRENIYNIAKSIPLTPSSSGDNGRLSRSIVTGCSGCGGR